MSPSPPPRPPPPLSEAGEKWVRQDLARCAAKLGAPPDELEAMLVEGGFIATAYALLRRARGLGGPFGGEFWEQLQDVFAAFGLRDEESHCVGGARQERTGFLELEVTWPTHVRPGETMDWTFGAAPAVESARTYPMSQTITRIVPDDPVRWWSLRPGDTIVSQDILTKRPLVTATVLRATGPESERAPGSKSPTAAEPPVEATAQEEAAAEPTPAEPLPFYQVHAIRAAWGKARARRLPSTPALERCRDALVARFGKVVAETFELEVDPEVFALCAHRTNWSYGRLVEHLFRVPGVHPDTELYPAVEGASDLFQWGDVYELASSLARVIEHGGAYSARSPATEALRLGTECAAEVFGDESGGLLICVCPWSEWFFDVAWDYTWIVVLPDARRVTVICATDQD